MLLAALVGPDRQPSALQQAAKHRASGVHVLSDPVLEIHRDRRDLIDGRQVRGAPPERSRRSISAISART